MRNRLKDKEFLLALFLIVAYYCLGIGNALNVNNTTYAVEQINRYDSNIFADNFLVFNGGMSARFFMNFIFGMGMKLTQGNWTAIALPIIFLGVIVLAYATVEIIFNISDKYRLFLACILAFLLRNGVNTGLAIWRSFELESIGMGTAYAFVILALSKVIGREKRWNAAWLFLSIATLCHVHEGLWGFCLLFIIYICQVVKEKTFGLGKGHLAFVIFVIVLGICVIPGVFGEPSGLTSNEFVDIYAFYRTPHHLVPSYWGMSNILKYFLAIVGTALIRVATLKLMGKENCKPFCLEASLAIGSWVAAIGVTYIFTEVIPVASVVMMFVPKYLKYVGILSQIWCIKCIRDWVKENEFMVAGLSIVTVYFALIQEFMTVVAFYGVFLVAFILWKKYGVEEMKILFPIGILGIVSAAGGGVLLYYSIGIIFSVYLIVLWNNSPSIKKTVNKTPFVVIASLLLILIATKDKAWTVEDGQLKRVETNSYLINGMGEELYNLALEFKETTQTDEMFLTDPDTNTVCWFQMGSERNSYSNSGNVPANQSNIGEWYCRIMETQGLFLKESDEICEIMETDNVNYLLVEAEEFEKFDSSGLFDVRNSSLHDQYRIYVIR